MCDGQSQKNKIEEPASLYASRERSAFLHNLPAPRESSDQFFNAVLVFGYCEIV